MANKGKLRIRRGTTVNWANDTLFPGQLGAEYTTNNTVRLKIGPSSGNATAWGSCSYIAPDQSIYTDTAIVNSSGHRVSASPIVTSPSGADSGSFLRNIVCVPSSTSDPAATNYPEGTILLKYTP